MAELHESLKYLGPAVWSDIPQQGQDLDAYLKDLFERSQLILDSVPIPDPDAAPIPPQAQPHGRARSAAEVTLSSERSATPPFGHEKFLKEWGKPMKIKAQDNTLGFSVYKMSSKDNKGSWFARRSVHEGIGFSRFKKSLQIEFEKSLAEQGPPGAGNVRGIGGEERVEQKKTDQAKVEVYRLSAQFPGPTAARDFVVMLVTSDNALQVDPKSKDQKPPRHYTIISRPCDHPQTQPRSGFVRGFYESVEFIREVPRKLKASQSSIDLGQSNQHQKRENGLPKDLSTGDLPERPRSSTVGHPNLAVSAKPDPTDPEDNPVEWIMVTRSDPGGGIPRFLVDRGTPGSICGDGVKFLNWACQNDEEDDDEMLSEAGSRPPARRQSHQSWRARSLAGVEEQEKEQFPDIPNRHEPQSVPEQQAETTQQSPGMFGAMMGAAAGLRPYTPQAILNHLPAAAGQDKSPVPETVDSSRMIPPGGIHADDVSVMSTTSFASAEDHLSSDPDTAEEESLSSLNSPNPKVDSKEQLQREKELRKLDEQKKALRQKFTAAQTKYDETRQKQVQNDADQHTKAIEKHEREMKKQQERYEKDLAKIEQKQEKERQKIQERIKKAADKDEKYRLTRERDEARAELELVKKEAESLRAIVQDLQKENTAMVIKLGKVGIPAERISESSRSRTSSLSRKDKDKSKREGHDLAVASAAASLKSSETSQS